jgi:transcription elongation factor Elf1
MSNLEERFKCKDCGHLYHAILTRPDQVVVPECAICGSKNYEHLNPNTEVVSTPEPSSPE